MRDLNNKVIVITGAGSGIGQALAIELAKKGSQLALNDWNKAKLQATRELVESWCPAVITTTFDVGDRLSWEKFLESTLQQFGHVDGIINNAGLTIFPTAIPELTPEDFERALNANLWGVINGCQVFLPALLQRKQAFIVNMSSIMGIIGYAGQAPYVTSKFAVRGFSETLRQELAGTGVKVMCVHPGPVKTNLIRNIANTDPDLKAKLATVFDETTSTTAEQAAKEIVKAVQRQKPRLLIGFVSKFMQWTIRLLPKNYHKLLPNKFRPGGMVAKARERRMEAALQEKSQQSEQRPTTTV